MIRICVLMIVIYLKQLNTYGIRKTY
jgi:hypothetical protein